MAEKIVLTNQLEGRYPPVGMCIYCGVRGTQLTDEHVIPLGLSGRKVLPRASCENCAKITSDLERLMLRGHMWPVRSKLGLKSRRPREAPTHYTLNAIKGDEEAPVELPIQDAPVLLYMPIFEVPACERPYDPYWRGIDLVGFTTILFGPNPTQVGKDLGADGIRHSVEIRPAEFARAIAKMALSYAIGELGVNAFSTFFVREAILGHVDNIGWWVGTVDREPVSEEGQLHFLTLHVLENRRVVVTVRLFAHSQTPRFAVHVGELPENWVPPFA